MLCCALALFLLIGLLLPPQQAAAAETELTQGQQNIVKRARQMTQIKWTPKGDILGWAGGLTYRTGVTYKGLPYGQPVYADYVPWETSLVGFLEAVNDPNSLMYTSYSSYNERAPYYSIDCSAFVSWAWGLGSRQTTSSIANYATAISTTSYTDAQVGDCLNLAGSHVVLITDITYDDSGEINSIEISESTVAASTNYCCQVVRYGEGGDYTLEYLVSKYFGNGYTLYRSKTRDSVTYTHSCAVPLEGDSCSDCGIGDYSVQRVSARVTANGDVTLYSLPSGDASILGTVYDGSPIEITGYQEAEDLVWYKTADGEWVKADETLFEGYLQTAELEGQSFPEGVLESGAAFPIRGTVTSVHPLVNLTGSICCGGSTVQSISLDLEGITSYTLDGSELDDAMRFNDLPDGVYTFELEAMEAAYCPAGGLQELETVWYSTFTVGGGCAHSYTGETVTEAGCETEGLTRFTCTVCGSSYEQAIPALGHAYREHIVEPDCENGGYTEHTCTRCSDSYRDSNTDPAGHSYIDGICTVCGAEEPGTDTAETGDLNADGAVTSADAVLLARYLADLTELSGEQLLAADVNGDGNVSSADAVLLARFLAGVIDEL